MSLHRSFTRHIYWPLSQKLKGEYVARALKDLSESQWKSQDELRTHQWNLLRRTVSKAAREVPFYRQTYAPMGWDFDNIDFSSDDFLRLPILEKETVRDHLSQFLNPTYRGRVTEGSTSGSTGKNLPLYCTSHHESLSEAARWRAKSWWEIEPGSPQVALWGRPYTGHKDRLAQQVKSYFMNTLLFSAFDIKEESLEQIWKKIYRFRPDIVYGYPSAIFSLARYLRKRRIHGDTMGVRVIMITAETSTPDQRSFIEEVFGCKTANEYGCSETGGFVYECPQGSWHISTELNYIEFLNHEGKPVTPGETGDIVVTHLVNDYMPLIRYRIGDRGSPLSRSCPCKRGLPLMDLSAAKESNIIQLPHGKTYMSGDFLYINKAIMKAYPSSILQFRVIQNRVDQFDIEVVAGEGAVDKAEELFAQIMKKQFDENIQVRFKRVSEIERDPTGKLRYFISEINTS